MEELLQIGLGLFGGLALFLYGMNLMSNNLQEAAGERMRAILAAVTKNPFFGVLAGALATAVLQSSSATTVMTIGFVAAGLMGLRQAIPIIMGANIGTTITAVLAAIGQGRDAKRVAAAHAIFNLSGAAVCCALLQPFAALVRLCSPTGAECAVIARQIANAHTLFNGLCALVWLPLTGQMVRLVCALLPDKNRPEERL